MNEKDVFVENVSWLIAEDFGSHGNVHKVSKQHREALSKIVKIYSKRKKSNAENCYFTSQINGISLT